MNAEACIFGPIVGEILGWLWILSGLSMFLYQRWRCSNFRNPDDIVAGVLFIVLGPGAWIALYLTRILVQRKIPPDVAALAAAVSGAACSVILLLVVCPGALLK